MCVFQYTGTRRLHNSIHTYSPHLILPIHDARQFPAVSCLPAPPHLREETTPMNAVLKNTLSQLAADLYLQTHSTNPLLKSQTIERAIQGLLDAPSHDSLFAVTRLQTRLYDANGVAINHDPDRKSTRLNSSH